MNDASDSNDDPLPARRALPPSLVPPAVDYQDDYGDPNSPHNNKRFSLRLIWRAFKRHWWFALPLWLAVSAGLVFLAYTKIKPTYDAVSIVEVQHGNTGIFTGKDDVTRLNFDTYLRTQVKMVTSPTVIGLALDTHPDLMKLDMLRGSKEPAYEIEHSLKVWNPDMTNWIRIELASPNMYEPAQIVNAVVEAYIKHAEQSFNESTDEQIKWHTETKKEHEATVANIRQAMSDLTTSMGVSSSKAIESRTVTTRDTYLQLSNELMGVKIKHVEAKANLDQLKANVGDAQAIDQAMIDGEVNDLLNNNPAIAPLQAELAENQRKLNEARRRTRILSDPTITRPTSRIAELTREIEGLRKKFEPAARRKAMSAQTDFNSEKAIEQAQREFTALLSREQQLEKLLNDLRIENQDTGTKELKLTFLNEDLSREQGVLDKIQALLNELKYQVASPIARVRLESEATVSARANSDRRSQAMILAPIATGFAVMLLLILLELRGARVNDPEELSTRMNLQVIGVVPPLPQLRSSPQGGSPPSVGGIMSNSEMKAQRQLDEFVQSLDHLRVALCARKDPWGRDKHCVLITSACGSEGKTTLAAQLAERCVNAGLMTLLIDADLRNPTLSRMLDAVDNPGLINVLRGEMLAEDVVTVIGDAGGFHLLPAGTPKMDPSRLLQGDRLGKLLAQARESFDMIIVDAPPVLPVPDALTIGKWTDGAVLAVRYDTSRFPLVERANRRLAHVGVPVIGAVVNGVRSMESAYGGYYAYGGYGSSAPSGSFSNGTDD